LHRSVAGSHRRRSVSVANEQRRDRSSQRQCGGDAKGDPEAIECPLRIRDRACGAEVDEAGEDGGLASRLRG